MKYCKYCKKYKPPSKFRKRKSSPDGLQYKCKECQSKYDKRNYLKKREMKLKQRREYYNKNRDKCLQWWKKYRKDNPNKIKESVRRYRKTDRAKMLKSIQMSRRYRKLKSIPLFDNPFPSEIKINWHHISDMFIVPVPEVTHLSNYNSIKIKHRDTMNEVLYKIYCIDFKKLIEE